MTQAYGRPCAEQRAWTDVSSSQGARGITRSWTGLERSSLRASGEPALPAPWSLTSDLQNGERIDCCSFGPCLWSFVTEALANKLTGSRLRANERSGRNSQCFCNEVESMCSPGKGECHLCLMDQQLLEGISR